MLEFSARAGHHSCHFSAINRFAGRFPSHEPNMKIHFRTHRSLATWTAALTLAAVVSGCGSSEPVAENSSAGTNSDTPSGHAAPASASTNAATSGDGASSGHGGEPTEDPGGGGNPSRGPSGSGAHDGAPSGPSGAGHSGGSSDPYGEGYSEMPSGPLDDYGEGYGEGYGEPYGEGYGGEYGGSARSENRAEARSGMLGFAPEALAESLARAAQAAGEPFPNDYGSQAELAFKQGYEALAEELLTAHLATEFDEASERYDQVRLSRALGRPVWFVRWGLAISVKTPAGFDGDVNPITDQTRGSDRRAGGGGSPYGGAEYETGYGAGYDGGAAEGYPGSGRPAAETPAAEGIAIADIEKNLGLFATVTGEMFDTRFAAGDFGPVFASLVPRPTEDADETPRRGTQPAGEPDYGAGYLGEDYLEESSSLEGAGEYPGGYPGGAGGNPNRAPQATPAPATVAALPKPHPRWRPGIIYLGEQDYRESLEDAKQAGVDFLLHFAVNVERARERVGEGEPRNETRVRVVNLRDPQKPIAPVGKLSNTEVRNKTRASNTEPREMVAETLRPIFNAIDRQLKLQEMPSLSETQAKNRIAALLVNSADAPLDALAEIQLYRSRGLLTEEEVLAAAQMLMGDAGLRLFAGSEPVRREVSEELRPRLTAYEELGMEPPQIATAPGAPQRGAANAAAGASGEPTGQWPLTTEAYPGESEPPGYPDEAYPGESEPSGYPEPSSSVEPSGP